MSFFETVNRRIHPHFGDKRYSIIHVEDLCQVIRKAADASVPSGSVYYVSSGEVVSFDELLDSIAKALQKKTFKISVPISVMGLIAQVSSFTGRITGKTYALTVDKMNEIRPNYWICSNAKACAELQFEPLWKLQAGVAQTAKWYQDAGWIR